MFSKENDNRNAYKINSNLSFHQIISSKEDLFDRNQTSPHIHENSNKLLAKKKLNSQNKKSSMYQGNNNSSKGNMSIV